MQFIVSVESTLEEAFGKREIFKNKFCLNRVFQFDDNAAYLRLQRSSEGDRPPELIATVALRAVPGEAGAQAIQGVCSHVSLRRKASFFFTRPQDESCKKVLVDALETLFVEAEALEEKEQAKLTSENKPTEEALEAAEAIKPEVAGARNS